MDINIASFGDQLVKKWESAGKMNPNRRPLTYTSSGSTVKEAKTDVKVNMVVQPTITKDAGNITVLKKSIVKELEKRLEKEVKSSVAVNISGNKAIDKKIHAVIDGLKKNKLVNLRL